MQFSLSSSDIFGQQFSATTEIAETSDLEFGMTDFGKKISRASYDVMPVPVSDAYAPFACGKAYYQ